MRTAKTIVWSILTGVVAAGQLKFPPGFKFGAASSAHQVEGAWNVSDKGLNIWDVFSHRHNSIVKNLDTGDVACDSYHQYKRDVQMAKELGLHFYRFSISWARLLPSGFTNKISENGKRYYNNLIDELLSNGIEPLVTIYHWDLPQSIQDLGGWTNPLIVNWFGDYARVVYSLFGNRVRTWITINEPMIFCDVAYNTGTIAPGVLSPGIGTYLCSKHVNLAHARAYRIYDEEFRGKYNGKVSITNQLLWIEGLTDADEADAEILRHYSFGIYSHPIFSKEGGWPPVVENILAVSSEKEGFKHSRLPAFTEEEIKYMRGTYDFYGVNYYSSRTVRKAGPGEVVGPYPMTGVPDLDMVLAVRPHWRDSDHHFFKIYPEGLRKILFWLKKTYGDMEFLITENGFAAKTDDLQDDNRVDYIHDHLEQVLLSIKEDAVNVTAYTAWTIMDNFEWSDGYSTKFGLYAVDFNHPQRTRTPKKSAKYYERVIKAHSLPPTTEFKDEL